MDNQDLRLAVLIDADNAPRSALRDIMAEAAVYGTPTVKRIYGDWTTPNMASWKPLLLEHAITPIQQYSYTTGKNATDSAMIIDAMDLLYSGRCDGFVLVSSDSDFTRLATRLREAGMKVYGMGEKKTPLPFIVACDKFIYIEVIRAAGEKARQEALAACAPEPEPISEPEKENQSQSARKSAKKTAKKKAAPAQSQPPEPEEIAGVPRGVVDLIADSLESIADEDGYGFMGKLGNLLLKKQPDFDPRNYGYSKLTQLVKALDRFEVVSRQTSADDPTKHVYLRDKHRK